MPPEHNALDDRAPARVVAIGGLDSTGGAGLVRDFATARSLGARVTLVPTAYTLQEGPGAPRIDVRPADALSQDLAVVMAGCKGPEPVAVKIGMVASEALVPVLVKALADFHGPVVYDPVLAASSGARLFEGDLAALQPLLAQASLLTPNLAEAAALTGLPVADLEGARTAAGRLRLRGAGAVLVKGGHLPGDAVDLLVHEEGDARFDAPRVADRDPRGTGCALATAIAVHLARGLSLRGAVREAKKWLLARISESIDLGGARWL